LKIILKQSFAEGEVNIGEYLVYLVQHKNYILRFTFSVRSAYGGHEIPAFSFFFVNNLVLKPFLLYLRSACEKVPFCDKQKKKRNGEEKTSLFR